MQNVLRRHVFNLLLFLAIAATIFQSSTSLAPDEYYIANATLILIESPDDVYFDIRNELPMPTIHYKLIDDPDYADALSAYGFVRNSSNTNPISVLHTPSSYSGSFDYIMARFPHCDYDILHISLRYLLPNTFIQDDEDNDVDSNADYINVNQPAFPQGGAYLISKGFTQLLTVDEAMPCNQPWYFHVYLTKDGAGNRYTVLLRAIYQMDMNPVYYCSTSSE